jgi:hypothetical protein
VTTVELKVALTGDILAPAGLEDGPVREGSHEGSSSLALLIKLFKLAVSLFHLVLAQFSSHSHHIDLNLNSSTA